MSDANDLLGGRPVRALDARLAMGVLLGGPLAVALLSPAFARAPFPILFAGLAAFAAGVVAISRRWTAGMRLVNDGLVALHDDQSDRAVELFRAAATGWHFKHAAGVALNNLATVAVRRGDFVQAIALSRASFAMLRGGRLLSHPQTFGDVARTNLAFCLACGGEVAEAERVALEASDANAQPVAAATLVRARALVALKRERWADALDLLDGERRLLRNVLTGRDAALVDAFEAMALDRLGGEHRGEARPRVPVPVDDDERAYVLRVLPEAERVLARA